MIYSQRSAKAGPGAKIYSTAHRLRPLALLRPESPAKIMRSCFGAIFGVPTEPVRTTGQSQALGRRISIRPDSQKIAFG